MPNPVKAARAWQLPIDAPHRLGRRAGEMCFVGGTADLDQAGRVMHPGNLLEQAAGALANLDSTLQAQGCDLDDVLRVKVFFRPEQSDADGWRLLVALQTHLPDAPSPVISMQPVSMMPWDGAELQIQAIAVRGWRESQPVLVQTATLPEAAGADAAEYTVGLRAGGFFATTDVPGYPDGFEGDPASETTYALNRLDTILNDIDVTWGDVIKKEGYYLGTTSAEWEPLAKQRSQRFVEGSAVATVVPWHRPWPKNVTTKIELLGYRSQLGRHGKRTPRSESWPAWLWDWPMETPFRQGLLAEDCIWLGGQIPYGAGIRNLQSSGDLNRQIDVTMSHLGDILEGFGRRLEDLVLLVCYYASDGSEDSSQRFIERLAKIIPGQLPPITLVPQPMVHYKELMTEIWGIARA